MPVRKILIMHSFGYIGATIEMDALYISRERGPTCFTHLILRR
jgi:hypothetical protein